MKSTLQTQGEFLTVGVHNYGNKTLFEEFGKLIDSCANEKNDRT